MATMTTLGRQSYLADLRIFGSECKAGMGISDYRGVQLYQETMSCPDIAVSELEHFFQIAIRFVCIS